MSTITTENASFKKCTYTLSILPIIPAMELVGFAEEGITWEDVELASTRLGADGYRVINQKPIERRCTITLLPNSPCRNILDNICALSTPKKGKTLVSYYITLIERNTTTGITTTYTDGVLTNANGGNSNNMNDGQANKTYTISFSTMLPLPL